MMPHVSSPNYGVSHRRLHVVQAIELLEEYFGSGDVAEVARSLAEQVRPFVPFSECPLCLVWNSNVSTSRVLGVTSRRQVACFFH